MHVLPGPPPTHTGRCRSLPFTIIAALILAVTRFVPTGTLQIPPNDFMLIAWNPGQQLMHHRFVDLSYPYPLWTPVLLLPFALWSPETGAQLWLICNLLLLAVSVVMIMRLVRWPCSFAAIAIASLLIGSYDPVFTSLWLGQTVFVSLAALILLLQALQSGHWTAVGALLGISLIKPQAAILVTMAILGLSVWQRRWEVFAGFGAVLLFFLAIAAPFAATPRQILGGGVAEHLRLYLAQTSTLWGLSLVLVSPSLVLPTLVSCLLCGWVGYLWISALRTSRSAERMMYLIVVTTIVNLLIIPYSWSYNHALLVLPFCYAMSQAWRLSGRSRLVWIASLFGLIYPFSRLIYTTLTAVHQSDVFQIIPVLLFLPFMVALQRHVDRSSKQIRY